MVGIPAYIGQQKSATRSEAYTNLQNLRLLEEQFFADNGVYTTDMGTAAGLQQQFVMQTLPQYKPTHFQIDCLGFGQALEEISAIE